MAEAPVVKLPPPPFPIVEGTEFVKNSGGAIWDVEPTHPAVEGAKAGTGGWRYATSEEIRDYCERHNLVVPDLRSQSTAPPKAEPEVEEPRAATASEERLATATAKVEKK